MNKFIGIGNLTKDIEIVGFGNDTSKVENTIAINEGKDKNGNEYTTFVDIEVWNKQAEYLSKYARKGSKIAVEGRLRVNQWQAEDGTNRKRVLVVVDRLEIMVFPDKEESKSNTPVKDAMEKVKNTSAPIDVDSIPDDDLPW